jgi:hypothetical protein
MHTTMTNFSHLISPEYWQDFSVTEKDIEFIQNYLFETETPLTTEELTAILVEGRINNERDAATKKQLASGKVYSPKESYKQGNSLVFPALNWKKGKVTSVRPGTNPEVGSFDVIEVEFEDGAKKSFASCLEMHVLNNPQEEVITEELNPVSVIASFGKIIEEKVEAALIKDENLALIAGSWFPRALFLDVSVGNLNLAEAILEMAGGEPMTAPQLVEQLDLGARVNPKLAEFSLNFALQQDRRFDEVGPAGQVLWCLERLEPEEVRNTPVNLQYKRVDYDQSVLSKQMIGLDAEIDDELSDLDRPTTNSDQASIYLTYPHWRAGTLPVSRRLSAFFPTAFETSHVRFTLVDARSGEKIPAWVVLDHGYVYGLSEWFKKLKLFPGSQIVISRSAKPGEVIIEAKTHKPVREWVRTVIVGSDGGLVFAVLKQDVITMSA